MEQPKVITSKNAGNCTAYELRQELVRRGAFDLDENKVNFKLLLQRLMVELVAEENAQVEQKTKAIEDEAAAARELAKQERDRKKQEALERSKQRQANPDYFKARVETNEEAAASLKEKASLAATLETTELTSESEQNEEEEDGDQDNDPFRTYGKRGKNRVFVK